MEKDLFEIYKTSQMQSPSLMVIWQTQDFGRLGSKVFHFMNEKLEGQILAEIKPLGFFPFGGVRFKNNLVQAPESQFWACERKNLLIFKSDEPSFEHFSFLNAVLDFAQHYYHIGDVYTLSGAVFYVAHTMPRRILSVFNEPEFQNELQGYGLEPMTWEGPPAISSYLLWTARRRGISGVSLWPAIPFYLASEEDPQAIKMTLSFLNRRFNLDLGLEDLDLEIECQNKKIAELRGENPEINDSLTTLENGRRLDEEEQLKLTKTIHEVLREK